MNHGSINRRQWIARAALGATSWAHRPQVARAAPQARVESTHTVSAEPSLYHGWPTLARRRNGQLLLVYSGGREGHVCPFGRVELIRSNDEGHTWTWPQVILDGPIDDRDAGVVETRQGTLLVSTFTSLAFEPLIPREPSEQDAAWPPQRLVRWRAARDRLSAQERRAALGCWIIRSTDGGRTWSAPIDSLVSSPHGPVPLADGRLLYAGKTLWRSPERVGACESLDDGQSWRWLAEIPPRSGDDPQHYHELHAVETADGRIIAAIRNHNPANADETLQSESSDGGRTWSVPRAIGVWGYPAHLLRLRDDRLLMSLGHRRAPLGNQARLSADNGRTWSEPLIVSADGAGGDLGYPSTVELPDGHLLTAWYERPPASPAVLRLARWRLD